MIFGAPLCTIPCELLNGWVFFTLKHTRTRTHCECVCNEAMTLTLEIHDFVDETWILATIITIVLLQNFSLKSYSKAVYHLMLFLIHSLCIETKKRASWRKWRNKNVESRRIAFTDAILALRNKKVQLCPSSHIYISDRVIFFVSFCLFSSAFGVCRVIFHSFNALQWTL